MDARRELRLAISVEGLIGSTRIGRQKVELIDLSCRGCRIGTVARLVVGNNLVVTLPGVAPLGAEIRWQDIGSAGLRFAVPLHPLIVERLRTLAAINSPGS